MGNCGNCCGKQDQNEIVSEKNYRKGVVQNKEADKLCDEIKKNNQQKEVTKIQASFRGFQARKEVE